MRRFAEVAGSGNLNQFCIREPGCKQPTTDGWTDPVGRADNDQRWHVDLVSRARRSYVRACASKK